MTKDLEKGSPATAAKVLQSFGELLSEIYSAYGRLPDDKRLIVGIAGAPASGKSTLSLKLCQQLNAELASSSDAAVVVPMDGYHLDNSILEQRDLRHVKGAPHTFDASGFLHLLQRLSAPLKALSSGADDDTADVIYIPVFDRAMDLARCAATAVERHHRIVLVEGNYLLLDRPVWRDLASYLDLSVSLNVPLTTLEKRLVKRWLDHGHSSEAASARALENDIPNARVVTEQSTQANFVLDEHEIMRSQNQKRSL